MKTVVKNNFVKYDDEKAIYGNIESNLYFLENCEVLKKDQKILEIGSGKGFLLNHMFKAGYDIRGIDIDQKLIDEGKSLYLGIPLEMASGDKIPFDDGIFDVVMSFDLFEHIRDSDQHMREVKRVLKPGGFYILQTPNKYTNMIFEPIRHTKKFGISKAFGFLEDHCALHSYLGLKKRFKKNGFNIQFHKIPVVNDFFKQKIRKFLGGFGSTLIKIINPDKMPLFLRTNLYAVGKKIN
jgi:SAM-dependent methyltransferase